MPKPGWNVGVTLLAAGWSLPAAQTPAGGPEPPRAAGIVVDGADQAVAHARLQVSGIAHPELPPTLAWNLGEKAWLVVHAVADARGVFRVDLPHGGPFALVASAADGRRSGWRFPVMAGDFVTLRLHPAVSVAGMVRHADGTPAPGARVRESFHNGAALTRERCGMFVPTPATLADDAGRFRLQVTDGDPVGMGLAARSLRAWTDTHASGERFYRVNGQSLEGIELILTRPATMTAELFDSRGNPVVAASVTDVEDTLRSAGTDAGGRFVLTGVTDDLLCARAPGHAVAMIDARAKHVLQAASPVRLRIMDGLRPAAGCRVALATRAGSELHVSWLARTDADGQLVVREAHDGVPLHAFVELRGRFLALPCVVPAAERVDTGELCPAPGRSVTGTVLTHDGLRRPGAMVLLQQIVPELGEGLGRSVPAILCRLTYTDRGGRFRFDDVPHVPHRLAVLAEFDGVGLIDLGVRQDAGTIRLAGGTVAGQVVWPDLSPAAHARVSYILHDEPSGLLGLVYLHGSADAEGRFVVRGLPPHGSFTIWATCFRGREAGMAPLAGARTEGATVQVMLQPHAGRH